MSNFNDENKDSRANITFNQIKKKRRGKFVILIIICLFMVSLGSVFTAMIISDAEKKESTYINQEGERLGFISKESSTKLQDLIGKTIKSVVSIISVVDNEEFIRETNVGTGIVLNEEGYIVSSYYSISSASKIKIKTYNDIVYEADIVGFDSIYDIALLKVEPGKLTPINISDKPVNVKAGDKVMSIGNPLGKSYNGSIEIGTVVNTRENVMFKDSQSKVSELLKMIKTTVPPKFINSGAALFNLSGEFIGVNNTTMTYHKDYLSNSFYISIDDLNQITNNILDKQDSMIDYMGIYGESAVSKQKDGIEGVYAKEVIKNGLAYEVGIRPTDIITEVDGIPVNCVEDINSIIEKHNTGEDISFTIYKNGIYSKIHITISDREK